MIFDDWTNFAKYDALLPEIAEAIQSFRENASPDMPGGTTELGTSLAKASVFDSHTNPDINKAVWEIHHEYADIQTLLVGSELNRFRTPEGLAPKMDFNEKDDYQLFLPELLEDSLLLTLTPQRFAIYLPNEAHITSLAVDGVSRPIRKIVFKIHKSLFKSGGKL